jgi:hypothetical protein
MDKNKTYIEDEILDIVITGLFANDNMTQESMKDVVTKCINMAVEMKVMRLISETGVEILTSEEMLAAFSKVIGAGVSSLMYEKNVDKEISSVKDAYRKSYAQRYRDED